MASAPHTLLEDAQAILAGTLLVSLGVVLVGKARLMTGVVVGLTFLLHYATDANFGRLFFLLNLPFYILAWKKLGRVFVAKTFISVALVSAFAELVPHALVVRSIDPWYAAIIGGLLTGVGTLILFRHQASLGGFNVLVLYLQDRFGWRAGAVQLVLDGAILLASIPIVSAAAVGISLLGAAVLNLSLAINHRPGRYVAI